LVEKSTYVFVGGIIEKLGGTELIGKLGNSLVVFLLIIGLATWMDKRKIYFKL